MALWEDPAMTRILGRRLAVLLAALLSCTAALAATSPVAGSAAARPAAPAAAPAGLTGQRVAPPGANLLLNPGAQTGAVSAQGWDAVKIPGWQVSGGRPAGTRRHAVPGLGLAQRHGQQLGHREGELPVGDRPGARQPRHQPRPRR